MFGLDGREPKQPKERKVNDDTPWFKNAFVFTAVGVGVGLVVLVADVALILHGVEGGLPEAVSTPMFNIASGCLGYAGACITHRTKQNEPKSAPTEETS